MKTATLRQEVRGTGQSRLPGSAGRAHLIGIAGAGMQSLARVLAESGWQVGGSDLNPAQFDRESSRRLKLEIQAGHDPAHLPLDADLVVASDAIPAENPERRFASACGILTFSYPQMLGRLMAGRTGLAVCGTHGKSTTTAMAAGILVQAGLDPTVVIGAQERSGEPAGRSGQSDLVLVEACEYRANFLHLRPRMAVMLGIEPDHFDYYRSPQQLQVAFASFARLIPEDGLILAHSACPATMHAARDARSPVKTFGFNPAADWRATDLEETRGCYRYRAYHRGRFQYEVQLSVPGRHQVLNSLAAAALAHEAGARDPEIRAGLAEFRGLKRRFEEVGNWQGVTLLDDYAHHPTEVRATLATVRQCYPGRRVWCVFQPHQASRTWHLLDDFALSLQNADCLAVAEIFRAREPSATGQDVTAADLARRVREKNYACGAGQEVLAMHELSAMIEPLRAGLIAGDVLVTIGAGDVRKILSLVPRTGDSNSH